MAVDSAPRRRRRLALGATLTTVLASVLALITLLGLAPFPAIPDGINLALSQLSTLLIRLVTVVGGLAVIIGALNLIAVNLRKLRTGGRGAPYSLVTLIGLVFVIALHLAEHFGLLKTVFPEAQSGGSPVVTLTFMDATQVAIESALAGLLFFFLVYAAYRMMRRRVSGWSLLFVATLLIVLIGYIPMSNLGFLSTIRDWVLRVPVSAGTRGILIGVALGTIVVGIRLLIGQDRTFRE